MYMYICQISNMKILLIEYMTYSLFLIIHFIFLIPFCFYLFINIFNFQDVRVYMIILNIECSSLKNICGIFVIFFSIFILFIILLFTTIHFASISTYSVKSQGLLLKLFHIHISDIINNSCSHFYHRFNVTKFFRFYIPFSLDFSIHRNYTIIINTFVQLFPFFPFFCPCLFQCKQQQH